MACITAYHRLATWALTRGCKNEFAFLAQLVLNNLKLLVNELHELLPNSAIKIGGFILNYSELVVSEGFNHLFRRQFSIVLVYKSKVF